MSLQAGAPVSPEMNVPAQLSLASTEHFVSHLQYRIPQKLASRVSLPTYILAGLRMPVEAFQQATPLSFQ